MSLLFDLANQPLSTVSFSFAALLSFSYFINGFHLVIHKADLEPSMIFIRPSLRVAIADYEKAKHDLTYRIMWVSIAMDIAILLKRSYSYYENGADDLR